MTSVIGCASLAARSTSMPSYSPMRRSVSTTSKRAGRAELAPLRAVGGLVDLVARPRSIIASVVRMLR